MRVDMLLERGDVPRARIPRRRPGQTLLEFAFVVPMFLTMILGIIEYSWAVYSFNTIQHAANEGVRRAMVLNRPAGKYALTGNRNGTALTVPVCDPATILGTVACSAVMLTPANMTVDVDVPTVDTACPAVKPANSPPCFTPTENVPGGNRVSITVHLDYHPLVLYPLNRRIAMAGYATSQTQ
jgi:Flp pilus assembly protein TadG